VIRAFSVSAPAGAGTITWDGTGTDGARVADGQYLVDVRARDATGNVGTGVVVPVAITTARSGMAASPAWISPAGRGTDPRASNLSFTLARPATVTWRVTTSAGAPVRTWYTGSPMDAGVHVVRWDGRSDAGALVPKGRYLSQVTVDDGVTSTTEQILVYVDGIRMAMSDTTPAVGQLVTVTAVAVEALGASPSVSITQPGRARISYRMTKVGAATYRVQFRFKAGPPGAVTVQISGVDRFGRPASATIGSRLH
jgi:flagellar hook assembly protein FlgD